MPTWLIVFLLAVLFVGLFVLGMSLTLMIKGRNIDSEIATNKNMQRLGIRCAVQESREDAAVGNAPPQGFVLERPFSAKTPRKNLSASPAKPK